MEIFLELGPIEGIVGVFGRLGREDKVGIAPDTVFQVRSDGFRMGFLFIEKYGPGNMGKFMILTYQHGH